jgi:hypothetical protein
MTCPSCQKNVIPWLKLWLMSGYGTHCYPSCGATCRLRKSWPLKLVAVGLGAFAGIVGYRSDSWVMFGAIFIAALILDALVDSLFRRLDLMDAKR